MGSGRLEEDVACPVIDLFSMKAPDSAASTWLQNNGLRLTRGRLAIIGELLHAPQPLTLSELHHRVKVERCDFATVFRFIQILEKKALVVRHAWNDRQLRYELAALPGAHHHHHLICKSCHRVEEIDACTVASVEKDLARQKGYAEVTHSLEFFGVCPDCQESASTPKPTTKSRKKTTDHFHP